MKLIWYIIHFGVNVRYLQTVARKYHCTTLRSSKNYKARTLIVTMYNRYINVSRFISRLAIENKISRSYTMYWLIALTYYYLPWIYSESNEKKMK